jgi:RNA polymerase sigma-70 factor (ECF subfamily)
VAEDDTIILRRVLAGDEDSFGVLVRRYEAKLRVYVVQIVGIEEEARDLVQETFVRVWNNLASYDPRFRFSTWLFRIARNLAIDHLRRRRAVVPLESRQNDEGEVIPFDPADVRRGPLGDLENSELAGAMAREISGLPPAYRELIVLRHFVGLAYNEIAELKGMPLGTVKNKLFRAHSVLREALGGYLGSIGGRE